MNKASLDLKQCKVVLEVLGDLVESYSAKLRQAHNSYNMWSTQYNRAKSIETAMYNPTIIKPGDPRWRDIPQHPEDI